MRINPKPRRADACRRSPKTPHSVIVKNRFERARFILFSALLTSVLGLALSSLSPQPPVHAFSSGPPAGYTGAPNEEPEACAECHVPPEAGTGQISINAPQTYIPGQTYQITVTHTNADLTRLRWGFQLTALDPADEKAGNLQSTDAFTQILNNAGPGGARQYVEHTSVGTFPGQQNSASWTFDWTAPDTDVGVITFYAAGNHANNDGNTSGDHIYRTFVASAPGSATPDFVVSASPASRAVTPGGSAMYTVTVTPLAGFTGTVMFSADGLPAGVTSSFNPTSVNLTDATSKTSTLTITTGAGTPLGSSTININAVSGMITHATQVTLQVIDSSSLDLSLEKTASPNPGQVGVNLAYRLVVRNHGPATATNLTVADSLPSGVAFVSVSSSEFSCSGTATIICSLASLGVGATASITIVVTPTTSGQLSNTATLSVDESDFELNNNSASVMTLIQPVAPAPTMVDPNLGVKTVFSGLEQPTTMAFLETDDFFVLEKATGKVKRIVNGVLQGTVLDLAVNSASERGLLGIALHPQFAANGFVYLFWTESNTGSDTSNVDATSLLGNRVDRYVWDGASLTFDRNLIRLRALQQDAGQPSRGNHNGGILRFGPDGKLYTLFGDCGRRGLLQNIVSGGPVPDDQFGGPEPDDAHLSGVILRLNDDGTTPSDNPFFNADTGLTGEAAANVKKIFAYGVRNGFGMAFDPVSGTLWSQENGDDAFDEMNRVPAGFNGGWIQMMGLLGRINEYKSIETIYGSGNLQQLRWPPGNIADTPQMALSRLFMLPGAQYVDPEFTWKYAVAPSTMGFVTGSALGPQYESDMFVGASRTTLLNGYLFRFDLTADRQHFSFNDPRLADLVADNSDKFDVTESESLVAGRDFGVATDIQTSPNGNLNVVSLSNGAVYEIFAQPRLFVANLDGSQEIPPHATPARGTATILLDKNQTRAFVSLRFRDLSAPQTVAHLHGPAPAGQSASPIFDLPVGNFTDFQIDVTPAQVADLKAGLWYVNVHSTAFPGGEIRGQFGLAAENSIVQLDVAEPDIPEGAHAKTINVLRLGDLSSEVRVDYTTLDGVASERTDYTSARGTLAFAAGESEKSFTVLITDDGFVEPAEGFSVMLSNPSGPAILNTPASVSLSIVDNDILPSINPVGDTQFFVRQHYHDFLDREPDAAGVTFWTNEIDSCGADDQCRELKRINVSAAFFLSIEFQQTGYLVYRMYKAAYGNLPNAPVPLLINEFQPDKQRIGQGLIVGTPNWEDTLETNKNALAVEFVSRSRFGTAYPTSLTPEQFVDTLFMNAEVTPSVDERASIVAEFSGAGMTDDLPARSRVVLRVAEHSALVQQEFNRAFVLMQYFGYLRRNPNDKPDNNFDGFNFWLNKLDQFNGNFVQAEMVKAFITSIEYRQRFGP